jgi:hypothetical protein
MKILGVICVDSNLMDQLMIRYSIFIRYWRKELEDSGTLYQLRFGWGFHSDEDSYCALLGYNAM